MTDSMILHHYDNSPYAEKIRLMFGLTHSHWKSLLSPIKPPRPNVDPLTGGYRRIPVAQDGADIFCDTTLIAEEIANHTGYTGLNPANVSHEAKILMQKAEKEGFFAAIASVSPFRLLGTMLRTMGPVEMIPFIIDRAGLLTGGSQKQTSPGEAKRIMAALLEDLDKRLSNNAWLDGDKPSVADFTVYHPLWLHVQSSRKPVPGGANVQRWYQAVTDIGHGQREETSRAYAFQIAKLSSPRPLPNSISDVPIAIGSKVSIAPTDYGVEPVFGNLAAFTQNRIIIARETEQFGLLHVHFPRDGYALKQQ